MLLSEINPALLGLLGAAPANLLQRPDLLEIGMMIRLIEQAGGSVPSQTEINAELTTLLGAAPANLLQRPDLLKIGLLARLGSALEGSSGGGGGFCRVHLSSGGSLGANSRVPFDAIQPESTLSFDSANSQFVVPWDGRWTIRFNLARWFYGASYRLYLIIERAGSETIYEAGRFSGDTLAYWHGRDDAPFPPLPLLEGDKIFLRLGGTGATIFSSDGAAEIASWLYIEEAA